MRTASFVASALALSCVGVPEPPPAPEDLSQLSASYEKPTASLPESSVRPLLDAASSVVGPLSPLLGFSFTLDALSDTSRGLAARANVEELEIAGRADATFRCPGYDGLAGPDEGAVHATLGVRASRLVRGFRGTVENCRFRLISQFGADENVRLSAAFVADLGADVRLGSPLPHAVLVKLIDAKGESVGKLGSVDLTRPEYDFRLTTDGELEALLDPASLGFSDWGTVVVTLNLAGAVGLRERSGRWSCGAGAEPCVRSP